ncbi:tetratricopeptide repeat protein [Aquisphaera insulae]|uniref:tetratricopeptide repeat protein n=1 Tax=Aquisphaera insulae TaxID=2712864 RepID=UPI0013EBEBBD|nr:tetratricopeptide repeat protein [Aquisphaera insulae]
MSARGGIRSVVAALAILTLMAGSAGTNARAGDDPRTAAAFLQALRDHGMGEIAVEYIDQLRNDPSCPAELRQSLDYLEGRTLIDEASRTNDLTRRQDLLEQARGKLDGFIKSQPKHALVSEARVQLARLLVERGHMTLLMADEVSDPAQKAARMEEARSQFSHGREAYNQAAEALGTALKAYPVSMPANDPRLPERDRLYANHLSAILQKAIAEYELAQTFPAQSADRNSHLATALDEFHNLWKDHRTQFAGLNAQMWEAKCFEEQGKIGEAIGIYKELLAHPAPELRPLQRSVGYFHIVALGKRKDYPVAADEAVRWLEKYNRREEQRSSEGLGVLLELAKNLDAQIGTSNDDSEKSAASKRIIDAVSQVVRYTTPYKNEALALLKKYKPSSSLKPEDLARLSLDDSLTQADEAMASRDWDRAAACLRNAIRKGDPRRDLERINQARFNLSFCCYMNKQYYESNVLAEHLARRYPRSLLAPKASEIAMQALADAYNTYRDIDRASDMDRLIDLAKYTAETFSDREQGDDARINLGMIDQGRGKFDQAIAEFASVREKSPKKLEAQTRLGGARWAKSRVLERSGDAQKAATEAAAAIDVLTKTLQARQAAGASPADAGLVNNAADLAVALTDTGKPAEALALLAPIIQAQTTRTGVTYSRLLESNLMAQIAANQVEPAMKTMKSIEQAGSSTSLVQLYLRLGRLFERSMDQFREKKDAAGLERMRQAYRSLLNTMAESRSGQSFESLEWAGRGLLSLNAGPEAEKLYRRILEEAVSNPSFLSQSGSSDRILLVKLKLAAALRLQAEKNPKRLDEAASIVEEVLAKNTKYLEPQVEKGMLLEAQAAAGQSDWSLAFRHWQDLAQKLSRARPRPLSYFDAWYHAADCLRHQKDNVKARQTLNGVMRLNPGVGGPEMKKKYDELLAKLK